MEHLPPSGTERSFRPALAPGDVLAERFEVARFLARGGMGEVYEALDRQLDERVALKTLRPDVAEAERALGRFTREINLSRRVTHPNVCRVYDLFWHRPVNGPELAFLSMELLVGESLADRLRRGRLTTAEALPIARDMAAALDAAHAAGVVHRDLKSGNVMLVTKDGGPPRAVITDFGLARGDGGDGSQSSTGAVVGTAAYMAPEQAEGKVSGAAADVYAFGVVLYEMVTGAYPHSGDSPLALLVNRLKQPPSSPRARVADLPVAWEDAILRCLEIDPARRFARAADVVGALERTGPIHHAALPPRRRAVWLGAAAALVLVVASFGYSLLQAKRVAPEGARPRRSVAVLGPRNLSGGKEQDWLSTAFAEMLSSELSAGEALRTIPGESVARATADLALDREEPLSPRTLSMARRSLGSDLLVLGSYRAQPPSAGGAIQLDLQLVDAATGELLTSLAESGTHAGLLELVTRAGSRLRDELGAKGPEDELGGARSALPGNPEAARLYAEGLARMRVIDALGARAILERVTALAPEFPLGHAALAEALRRLGYETRAREAAAHAVRLASSLSREDRLLVEARHLEVKGDVAAATRAYRELMRLFPDNLDYGLKLAWLTVNDRGREKETEQVLAVLRKLPRPVSDDPRIDMLEGWCWLQRDLPRAHAAADQAAAKAEAQGSRLLLAEATYLQGQCYFTEPGGLEAARERFGRARTLFTEAGDRFQAALMLYHQARLLSRMNRIDEALPLYRDYVKTAREVGSKSDEALGLARVGQMLSGTGDLEEAGKVLRESVAAYREAGDEVRTLNEEDNLATYYHERRGDLEEARRIHTETLRRTRELGNRWLEACALRDNVPVLVQLGDLAAARKNVDGALALFSQIRYEWDELPTRLHRARLNLEEGRAAEAADEARAVRDRWREIQRPATVATSGAVLARALLAQGQRREAAETADEVLAGARKLQDGYTLLGVQIDMARVLGALGRRGEAMKGLQAALAEAERRRYVQRVFEARLALGELELASSPAAGRARLRRLAEDARAKGYTAIAAKARTIGVARRPA